jgi:hypothetical protein
VLHYVGGKPWQSKEQLERNDWEGGDAYEKLFDVWHLFRNGHIVDDGTGEYVNVKDPEAPVRIGNNLSALVPAADV